MNNITKDMQVVMNISDIKSLRSDIKKDFAFYAVKAPRAIRQSFGYYLNPHPYRDLKYAGDDLDIEDWEVWTISDSMDGKSEVYTDDEIDLEIITPLHDLACTVPLARNRRTGNYHKRFKAMQIKEGFRGSIGLDPSMVDENTRPGNIINIEGEEYEILDRERPRFRSVLYRVKPGKQHLTNLDEDEQRKLGLYHPEEEIFDLALKKHNEWKSEALKKAEKEGKEISTFTRYSYSTGGVMIYPVFDKHYDEARIEFGAAKRKPEEVGTVIQSLDFSKTYISMLNQNIIRKFLKNNKLMTRDEWPEIMQESISNGSPSQIANKKLWVPQNMKFSIPKYKGVTINGDNITFDFQCEWQRVENPE